jgi:hypothetical protein
MLLDSHSFNFSSNLVSVQKQDMPLFCFNYVWCDQIHDLHKTLLKSVMTNKIWWAQITMQQIIDFPSAMPGVGSCK